MSRSPESYRVNKPSKNRHRSAIRRAASNDHNAYQAYLDGYSHISHRLYTAAGYIWARVGRNDSAERDMDMIRHIEAGWREAA